MSEKKTMTKAENANPVTSVRVRTSSRSDPLTSIKKGKSGDPSPR